MGTAQQKEEQRRYLRRVGFADDAFREVMTFIHESLRDDPQRFAALKLLEGFSGERGSEALLEFTLSGYTKEVRIEAIRLATGRDLSADQIRLLADLIQGEPDQDLRTAVVVGVQKMEGRAVEILLREALGDPSEEVRSIVVGALDAERFADKDLLIQLSGYDPSGLVRGNALVQLRDRVGDPGVLDAILASASKDSEPGNRKEAVQALGHAELRRNARVLACLQRIEDSDPSDDVRAEARRSFERMDVRK